MYEDELDRLEQAKKMPFSREIGKVGLATICFVGLLLPAGEYLAGRTKKCPEQEIRQIDDYRIENSPTTAPYSIATRPSD